VGLNSSQEEADTCIILHALNMNNQFKDKNVMGRIVIKSPDTDVLILLVHYFSRMSKKPRM
jgi:ABC-type hemin transport system ATPase subunit